MVTEAEKKAYGDGVNVMDRISQAEFLIYHYEKGESDQDITNEVYAHLAFAERVNRMYDYNGNDVIFRLRDRIARAKQEQERLKELADRV